MLLRERPRHIANGCPGLRVNLPDKQAVRFLSTGHGDFSVGPGFRLLSTFPAIWTERCGCGRALLPGSPGCALSASGLAVSGASERIPAFEGLALTTAGAHHHTDVDSGVREISA